MIKSRQLIVTFYSSLVFIISPLSAFAENIKFDDILTIDKPVISASDLFFPQSQAVQPDKSDFKILSAILLSSESGKRSATITFKNMSSGQRILTNNQVLAIFANGQKKQPQSFKQKFSGSQKLSINLSFGINQFPILSVYTRD